MDKYNFKYKYLNKKINDYLKYYDLDLNDLAISIGLSEKTLKKTLNNERDFYLYEIYKLVDVLKLNDNEITKAFFTINATNTKEDKNNG